MNAKRWQKVKGLFETVVELAPAERKRFLDQSCGTDDGLRRDVEKLLASFEDTESFLEQPAAREVASLIIEPQRKLSEGQLLAHYRILRQIGAGGMGEVYLAKDTRLHRKIALKILPALLSGDQDRLRRFEQEACAASALNHPNILTIYEISEAADTRYIATEFIDGETLRDKLERGEMNLKKILDVAEQTAFALSAAHAAHIVHRDIKPENIMLRADGIVKVLDFGLAKLTEKKEIDSETEAETRVQVNTQAGMILGTVAYMSPEQARGKEADARTDIWSLGVVLYEMLAGRVPYAGETTSDTIAAILKIEPAPTGGNTPPELNRIIRKALQKNADERYQTVKDLLLDLKNLKRELEFSEELERSHIPPFAKLGNGDTAQSSEDAATVQPTVSMPKNATQQLSSAEYLVSKIKKHKFVSLGLLAALVVALTTVGYFRFLAAPSAAINSIAVLPFVNESDNSDIEYLSDGMTESLINSLSQLPKLSVKARSSVFRYKGKDANAKTIGTELNAQAILNGRVVQRGQNLTLYIELIDAQTENVLWKENYNRPMTNLIALQNEIARDVSNKLRVKLSGADERKLAKNYTGKAEAYQFYLQGRFFWNKRTGQDLQKALGYFEQAIALDPNYALAYAGLADTYALLSNYGSAPPPPRETKPKAREAALKALSLDDQLAEAHAALGLILTEYDYDFAEAETQYKRAIELNPNYATAHQFYGELLTHLGRHEEASAELRLALEIDPLSLVVNRIYGGSLFFARRYDEALAQLKKTVELDANFASAHGYLSGVYQLKGNYAESNEEYAKFQELIGRPEKATLVRDSFARGGREGFLQMLIKEPRPIYLPAYSAAMFYGELGEKDKAFAELNKSYEKREVYMVWLKVDPRLDPLRDDPRFQDLMRRVGFEKQE